MIDQGSAEPMAKEPICASSVKKKQMRQKLLVLYLGNSALDSGVVGWSFYDGTGKTSFEATGEAQAPYRSGLAALRDGWRVISWPALQPPQPGREYEVNVLPHEFVFEKMEEVEVE